MTLFINSFVQYTNSCEVCDMGGDITPAYEHHEVCPWCTAEMRNENHPSFSKELVIRKLDEWKNEDKKAFYDYENDTDEHYIVTAILYFANMEYDEENDDNKDGVSWVTKKVHNLFN